MPEPESRLLHDLEVEVEAEMHLATSSGADRIDVPPSEWLIDPTDVEREEVELNCLHDAVEVVENEKPCADKLPQQEASNRDANPSPPGVVIADDEFGPARQLP